MAKNKKDIEVDANEYDKENLERMAGEPAKEEKNKWSTRTCKIISKGSNFIGLDFDGFGIKAVTDKDYKTGDIIRIKFLGQIGTKNFKYKL